MKCRMCNNELVNGARFCMYCGAKVGQVCPECGRELPEDALYCFMCGALVGFEVEDESDRISKILDEMKMEQLAEIKKQEEECAIVKGAPKWNSTPEGACDCAVGECDCDGSIWS